MFELPEALDITITEALLEKVRGLAGSGGIDLDASKVNRITTPAIQIIISSVKSQKNSGKELSIKNPSQPMREAFSDLGLEAELNQWSKIDG